MNELNYKEAYLKLFNSITDAIILLQDAQLKCEDILTKEDLKAINNDYPTE